MPALKIGVILSANGRAAATDLPGYARHAEALGLDSAFVGDHLAAARPILDSTVALTAAAAVTSRIHLGFGTMVLALRPVALAAKQLSTMQQLSGDRIILGVGTGGAMHGRSAWHAVGVPWTERGRRTDEALALLPALISGRSTVVNGQELTLAPGAAMPPIWIGGGSEAALRRSVRFGTAWYPSMMTAATARTSAGRLAELAAREDRPTPMIAMGGVAGLGPDISKSTVDNYAVALRDTYGIPADQAAEVPVVGSPRQAAERFAEFAEAGVSHLVLGIIAGDWQRQCDLIAQARALVD